ncbi:MAG: hypothetical protein KDC48_22560, partial [Planctomycetes bacterium]|nr:hypothetical protein [Planctomycetota bacterium]
MRSLSVLVAAALVVAVALWWWWSADAALPATPAVTPIAVPAPAEAAAGDAVAMSAAAERRAVAGVVDAAADAAAEPPVAGDAKLTTVTVVDGETGRPVAGAEVLWTDAAANRAMQQSLGGTLWWRDHELAATIGHADQAAERFGNRTSSDADGRVQLPLGEYATLVGRHGDRYGQLWVSAGLSPPAEGHRLVLEPDLAITALVVDHAGAPVAGAPVVVSAENDRGQGTGDGEVLTDGAGLATRRHLQVVRRDLMQSGRGGSGAQWRVRCSWSPGDDPGVTFAIDDLPGQPVRLQLPPTGRIRLTATLGGHPDAALAHVRLVEVSQDVESDGWSGAPGRRDADGWVRWRHVPLGKRFRVATWDDVLDRYAEFAG